MPISPLATHRLFPKLAALLFATGLCGVAEPGLAADEVAPKGAAVTVLKAEKSCFADIVEVAGILVPEFKDVIWDTREFSKFNKPVWVTSGIRLLKELAMDVARMDVLTKDIEILDRARRKTTQKVNLYEKVQIPEFSDAILKIKRYLEDVENLEKAAQKITKQRLMAEAGGVS